MSLKSFHRSFSRKINCMISCFVNHLNFRFIHLVYAIFIATSCLEASSNLIEIHKKGVLHRFVHFDPATDHFTQNIFPNWENDTFDAFALVNDQEGIAIDLGAWIGTTSIWLAKNFHHVIAVEPDRESLKCLRMNLEASDCTNVTICEKPVEQMRRDVIFGPRGSVLNESISYLKTNSDSSLDYTTKSITFKQLVHDTVHANEKLASRKITFVKCDIEGGEETILEDVLHFAYYNKCPVHMSFHLDWWKTKKITDFDYLFKYFDVKNTSIENITEFLQAHPFASLLLVPKKNMGDLIKQNLTAVIIGYNQHTYIKNMVSQLEKYTKDIVIIDNCSNYQPLLDYYQNEFKYSLFRQKKNFGHTIYLENWVRNFTGDIFILTDPDLQFNPQLPNNFIQELIDISNHYRAERVGFALLINSPDMRTDIRHGIHTVYEWEKKFWEHRLYDYQRNRSLILYDAEVDTTSCLYNRNYIGVKHIRVAGNFTCKHIPWHLSFKENFTPDEYESYVKDNISSNWFKPNYP